MRRFCVIGSLNIDIIVAAAELPKPGETVIADEFQINPGGGKGANQAFALARLGADVSLVGKIGDRFHGPEYLQRLQEGGVDCQLVATETGYPGVAAVGVDKKGENSIFVFPGANQKLDTQYIDDHWDRIAAHDCYLLQLEIPIETVIYCAKRLRDAGKMVILDPAPAQSLPQSLIGAVDFITPNLVELETLTGIAAKNERDIRRAADLLMERGSACVVVKAGSEGAFVFNEEGLRTAPAFHIEITDTTAAGDAFNAGFAFAFAGGCNLDSAIRFANAVAALSTTALGAQSAMPTLSAVKTFLESRPSGQ